MRHVLLTLCLVLCTELQASHDLRIRAEDAEYQANQVLLIGHVEAEHNLGRLSAQRACILSSPEQRQQCSLLQLFDQVEIDLAQGGALKCDRADIHLDAMSGHFRGGASEPFALYSDIRYSSSGKQIPLRISSDLITVQISTDRTPAKPTPQHFLSHLVAQGSVAMHYGDAFQAYSDRAIYRDSDRGTALEDDQLSGMIYLVPEGPTGTCEIRHVRGDHITARLIRIDADRENLFFDRPIGQVFFQDDDGMLDRISFQAEALHWDEAKHLLKLQHEVELRDLGMGAMYAEEEVEVAFDQASEEHEVLWIRAHGPTHLVFEDDEESQPRQLYCFGGGEVDNRSFQVQLKSPREDGVVPHDKQIRYKDAVGEAQADDVTVLYRYVENDLVPTKILIVGNVYMVNHAPFDPKDQTPVLQYAKADAVEYDPEAQEMLLIGKGRRVLFFDKLNNVQVSAPAIRMSRDKVTGKDSVQGIGDVRFRLIGKEMRDLLQPFEKESVASTRAETTQEVGL